MTLEPLISVVVLNYNGAKWLERCLGSVRTQSIAGRLELIVADNLSSDGSDALAEEWVRGWPNARFIQHGENLGYCEGNNRAARQSSGKYLFFLNNDTWLEADCLERLIAETEARQAQAATPLVLNYDDDSFQSLGAPGFDICGFASPRRPFGETREIFMPEGCSFLIDRRVFEELGRFDPVLFMYSDELDLAWRLWAAGYRAVAVPAARLHHRGAANVNPQGGVLGEIRTSETKRFYANRNGILVVWKNAQHLLLLLLPIQGLLLALEAAAGWWMVRRDSFVRRAYWEAVKDCWRLRAHVRAERRRISRLRKRSDWWMLRFLTWRLNRWDEARRVLMYGKPKVSTG